MMVDESKGKLRSINDQYGLDDNDHLIKATSLLHNHLVGQGKAKNIRNKINFISPLSLPPRIPIS